MKRPMASTVILLLWLAGCGGGGSGGGGGGTDPRLARLDAYEALELRVLGDPEAGVPGMLLTTDANIPAGGSLSFSGFATLRVEVGITPLVLFGDADLTVDFDSTAAVGAVENLFGNADAQTVADYDGALSLEGNATGQDMPLSYLGTLTTAGQSLGFEGALNGVFLGNPVAAVSASDLEAMVNQNGTTRDATVVITLERILSP